MFFRKNTRKLDFIVGGTQKGGTTALDYYLREHPEIGMAKKKEVHFFDQEHFFSKSSTDYSPLHQQFDFNSKKVVYGEATPIYLYWQPSCKRIWEYNSQIKLIFILRNPISRAFSHWNMEYNRGAEKEDFGYAIRNEKQRLERALPSQHRVYSYADRGMYLDQIQRYQQQFDSSQLLFVKYEDFNRNQEKVLKRIFDFLEVPVGNYSFERKTLNSSAQKFLMAPEDKEYLVQKFRSNILKVEKLLDWDCSDWLV